MSGGKTPVRELAGTLPLTRELLLPYLSAATRQSSTPILLTTASWRDLAAAQRSTPINVKIRRLLDWVASKSEAYGKWVPTDERDILPIVAARDDEELQFLLAHLRASGQVETGEIAAGVSKDGFPQIRRAARITVAGWGALSPSAGAPGTCFVAMSFDVSMNDAFDNGILPAIETDCGFAALRVDRVHHNDEITDQIIASIHAAQFVVADFTLQRQGVYYEAGFARGIGRQVVSCCRESDVDDLHFDTRNRSHVVWTDAADLRAKLRDRVRATIAGARQV